MMLLKAIVILVTDKELGSPIHFFNGNFLISFMNTPFSGLLSVCRTNTKSSDCQLTFFYPGLNFLKVVL